jgi:uncharacterized protein with HEPN domain
MRRDELYLVDMLEAADAVSGFLTAADETTFAESHLLLARSGLGPRPAVPCRTP